MIVWRAKDVVAKDGVDQPSKQEVKDGADPTPTSSGFCSCCSCCCGGNSGTSDVFVTAQFEGMDGKQETDVRHSWNARSCRNHARICIRRHSFAGALGQ